MASLRTLRDFKLSTPKEVLLILKLDKLKGVSLRKRNRNQAGQEERLQMMTETLQISLNLKVQILITLMIQIKLSSRLLPIM